MTRSDIGLADGATVNGHHDLQKLFQRIEEHFTRTQLGPNRWYLVVLACLTGGGSPQLADQLYLYLTAQQQYSSAETRQLLVRRLREDLVKSVAIVGVCRPIEAVVAISKVEREEDRDYSCTRAGWQCDEANHVRGMDWFMKLYRNNANHNLNLYNAHKDFYWISREITYGLYLSDRQVLDDIDTQLVVISGIMVQNLRSETWWHIRGTRRVGVSKEDMQTIYLCIGLVGEFLGLDLSRVPTVDEVEPDV